MVELEHKNSIQKVDAEKPVVEEPAVVEVNASGHVRSQ